MRFIRLGLAGIGLALLFVVASVVWMAATPITPDNLRTRVSRSCAVAMLAVLQVPSKQGPATGNSTLGACDCLAEEMAKDPADSAKLADALRKIFVAALIGGQPDVTRETYDRAMRRVEEIAPRCVAKPTDN